MSSGKFMEAENVATQPVMVRRVGRPIMPIHMENAPEKSRVWKRAGAVAAVGMLFGFAVSFWFAATSPSAQKAQRGEQLENDNTQQTLLIIPAESAPVEQKADNSAEVERLKTRNRRLEALVQVLRKRSQSRKR